MMPIVFILHDRRCRSCSGSLTIFHVVVLHGAVGCQIVDKTRSGEPPHFVPGQADLSAAIVAEIPRLRRHAASLLYSAADADDLVQDCLETALTRVATLKDATRLRPWMFAILNNHFLMRLRSGARRRADVSAEEFADSLAAAAPLEDRAKALDLARAMGKRSLEHRQVLLLINAEGYRYQEVAEILAIPGGTVMSRLARARERLRSLLEGSDLGRSGGLI